MWQPTASIDVLRERAAIIRSIRSFFEKRNVLELETPCLSRHTITDPHIDAMSTKHSLQGSVNSTQLYLQTSPEYAMKRLLASGSGDIFQIGKAFRDDEVGRLHNPEFTMLEWYRLDFDMQKLIDEVAQLLVEILKVSHIEQYTYCGIFEHSLAFDPINISLSELINFCHDNNLGDYAESMKISMQVNKNDDAKLQLKDSLLQVVFSQLIEPLIGQNNPAVVTHFPASQASLATLSETGLTANRFEVYFKGIELANGFNELTNVQEQLDRFTHDNAIRVSLGMQSKAIDNNFLDALKYGLPPCSGVALGVDRLVMLATNMNSLDEVMSFSYRNC